MDDDAAIEVPVAVDAEVAVTVDALTPLVGPDALDAVVEPGPVVWEREAAEPEDLEGLVELEVAAVAVRPELAGPLETDDDGVLIPGLL